MQQGQGLAGEAPAGPLRLAPVFTPMCLACQSPGASYCNHIRRAIVAGCFKVCKAAIAGVVSADALRLKLCYCGFDGQEWPAGRSLAGR